MSAPQPSEPDRATSREPGAVPAPRPSRRGGARRGHRAPRCAGCGLHLGLCVCAEVTPAVTRARVLVITTRYEVTKTTTSTRLLRCALASCVVRVRGRDDVAPDLADPARRAVLLYPTDDAATLDAAWLAADPRPVTLVVPDGTWRQTRRLARPREAALAPLPRVRLPAGPPSEFRLRSHPDPERLCTFEAVARALEVLEGPALRATLERAFAAWVDRSLWARGVLPAAEVRGGLPRALHAADVEVRRAAQERAPGDLG